MNVRAQLASLLVLAAIACGPQVKKTTVAGPTPEDPTAVKVPTPAGEPLNPPRTARITDTGGSLSSADGAMTVAVPKGAVAGSLEFSITPIANTARGGIGGSFRLGPEGTTFATPVTLYFKGPSKYPLNTNINSIGISYQDKQGYWHRMDNVVRDAGANTLSVTTTHFSDWTLTWQTGTPAAEGPITVHQGVGTPPFTAYGRASLFLQGDDATDTTYVMTGTLTLQEQSYTIDGLTCVPDAQTKTLPASVAEIHKGSPAVFRWGVGATWTLLCTPPGGGAQTSRLMPVTFDTMYINLTRCGGYYATNPAQVADQSHMQGTYTIDCGIDGMVQATWNLLACVPNQTCQAGTCLVGTTACDAMTGQLSCNNVTAAPNGTFCGGPDQTNLVCSESQCVDLNDQSVGFTISGGTTAAAPLVTTEAGKTATFTMVLNAAPTTNVTVGLSSSKPAEGTIDKSTLTFTPQDWNVAQTVTITGVDDFVVDGDQPYTIVTAPATSGDPRYDGKDPGDVYVVNNDNDVAGFVVDPTSGLVTSEAGAAARFTVKLTSQPTADVVIPLSSSNPGEGTVSPTSLTFTASNWSVAQTVTVTGVDDFVADGPIAYTVATGPVQSADLVYNGLDPADVSLTNTDNDTAGVTVSPTSGLTTTEAGGTATFTVVLNSQPTADVTIPLVSTKPTEGLPSPAQLVFTSANWKDPQTVTVTGQDDFVADGAQPYDVVVGPASTADVVYAALPSSSVALSNTDNDVASVKVTPAGPFMADGTTLRTTESGGAATFTVELTSQPTADVTIPLSTSKPTEGAVAPASLTFTAANWNQPQTVTVTGVDDLVADGDQPYVVQIGAASSADPKYDLVDPADLPATNLDNDHAAIAVTAAAGLQTTEAGGQATFTVALTSEPTAPVTIPLVSSNTAEGIVSPAQLVFDATNWNQAQTVTVSGIDDFIADGNQPYTVTLQPAVTADTTGYSGMSGGVLTLINVDNDVAGLRVTSVGPFMPDGTTLQTTEGGATATFTVVLTSQPTAPVTIPLASSNTGEGTVSVPSLTFDASNWSAPQTVTITGVNDFVVDGNQPYTVTLQPAVSADTGYSGRSGGQVALVNVDDDVAGVVVTSVGPFMPDGVTLKTTEAGATATFTVVLRSQPAAPVTIPLSSSNTAEGTVSVASITFDASNWSTPQTITVAGVNDFIADGNQPYTVTTGAAQSADASYAGFNAADVALVNVDDDVPAINVTPTAGLVTTEAGGTATFSISLGSQPTADVVVNVWSNDTTEGTVSPSSVTITAADWDQPHLVTVKGVDDSVVDGDQVYTIVTDPAASADPAYGGVNPADVLVTNSDDDVAGFTVSPTTGLVTTEDGGTATFTVKLTSQPTADVTVPLSSSNTAEGTVSPASLTFTSANWSTAQTVTVTGVPDYTIDGDQPYTVVTAPAQSADANYQGRNAADVSVTNVDMDKPGIIVSPTAGLVTTESGGTAMFSIKLTSMPSADVVVAIESSNTLEGTVDAPSVTIGAGDWNADHWVTITGVDDTIVDGDQPYTIVTHAAASADLNYNGLDPADVSVTNLDNDPGILVKPSALSISQAAGTATFDVVLTTAPAVDVEVDVTSQNPSAGLVYLSDPLTAATTQALSFTTATWHTPQTVTVSRASPDAATYTVTATPVTTDTFYGGAGVQPGVVTVTNTVP